MILLANCSRDVPSNIQIIDTQEAMLTFQCKTGWSPSQEITASCISGRWSPNPAEHTCKSKQLFDRLERLLLFLNFYGNLPSV